MNNKADNSASANKEAYWRANVRLMLWLLAIWFTVQALAPMEREQKNTSTVLTSSI